MTAIIGALPYTLTNNSTADASQVMANFNAVVSSVNASVARNGANADITALNALTTPITVPQGGTNLQQFGLLEGVGGCGITFGTNSITIAPGIATTTDRTGYCVIAAALTKTFSNWAQGSGVGGLDTGSIANSTWYTVWGLFAAGSSTVLGDACISAGAAGGAAPTLSTAMTTAGYNKWCRLGAFMVNSSGTIMPMSQNENEFLFRTPLNDYAGAGSASPYLTQLTLPLGYKVNALFRAYFLTAASNSNSEVLFFSPDETGAMDGYNSSSLAQFGPTGATEYGVAGHFNVRTNTSGQIMQQSNQATSYQGVYINTYGFTMTRGSL